MRSYLLLFTTALLFAFGLTPLVRRWAARWGAVDWPDDDRRIHTTPTPRLGGVAIYLAFLATLAIAPWLGNRVSEQFIANRHTVYVLLAAGTLIFALGVYDDFRGANAFHKIAVQLVAASVLWSCGLRIGWLSSPFGGSWELPVVLSFALTALWIVGITNAFNLIDGMDGLAAGASAFALLSLFICSLTQGHPEVSLLCIVLVGAVLGFLRYNFNPATIFLGDSGSLLLGFMAASLSLVGAQKSPTLIAIAIPLVSFGLPIAEVGLSLSRRFLSGAPLFQGDRRHIHHMLLLRGLTQRQAVILLYGICAFFSLFGLMLLNPQRNTTALVFFVLGLALVFGIRQLRYAEFSALRRDIKRGVNQRRRAWAAGSQWLQSLESLRAAKTIDELLDALTGLCESVGFSAARLEIAEESMFSTAIANGNGQGTKIHHLQEFQSWDWQWPKGKKFLEEIGAANCYWSLRLPLLTDEGSSMGALTLYHRLTNGLTSDKIALDLAHASELLGAELSAAVVNLLKPATIPERHKSNGDYWPRSIAVVGKR
ncbi:MAG: MraY family glycosyltransferase [Blastocatellales bacterium]